MGKHPPFPAGRQAAPLWIPAQILRTSPPHPYPPPPHPNHPGRLPRKAQGLPQACVRHGAAPVALDLNPAPD